MKKILTAFLQLPRFKQITITVLGLHLLFTIGIGLQHLISTSFKKKPKALVVRTVKIKPPPPKKGIDSASPQKKSEPLKKTSPSKPKHKNIVKKAPPQKKSTRKPKDDALLQEIAQSFDVFKSEEKKLKHLDLPTKIETKKELFFEKEEERVSYGEFLITYLQNSLDLPEYGDVKAKLTIDELGRLVSFEVIEAKSVKNAEFLKKESRELAFPRLDEFGIRDSIHTFTITFRNLEIH